MSYLFLYLVGHIEHQLKLKLSKTQPTCNLDNVFFSQLARMISYHLYVNLARLIFFFKKIKTPKNKTLKASAITNNALDNSLDK